MTENEQIYWTIVDEHIAPVMKEHGFERVKKDWFYSTGGECTRRLTPGFAKQRRIDALTMFVTVCVGFQTLRQFLSGCKDLTDHVNLEPDTRPCTMATDLGHLAPPFQHLSWTITPSANVKAIGEDIVLRVRRDGLKYFSDYGTLDRAAAAWRNGTTYNMGATAVLYLAAYEWLSGEKDRALLELRQSLVSEEMPSARHMYSCLLRYLESLVGDNGPQLT